MPTKLTSEIITAAIQGFAEQKRHIDGQIAELRAMLSGPPAEPAATPDGAEPKRRVSSAARRRMALAQKARWAKIKGESESPSPAAPEPPKKKRKLSAAGLKRIVEATKKRWAAVMAQKAAAQEGAARKSAVKKAKQTTKRR
jgi:hypothetical protein